MQIGTSERMALVFVSIFVYIWMTPQRRSLLNSPEDSYPLAIPLPIRHRKCLKYQYFKFADENNYVLRIHSTLDLNSRLLVCLPSPYRKSDLSEFTGTLISVAWLNAVNGGVCIMRGWLLVDKGIFCVQAGNESTADILLGIFTTRQWCTFII